VDEIRTRLVETIIMDVMQKCNKLHLLRDFRLKYDLNKLSIRESLDALEEFLEIN